MNKKHYKLKIVLVIIIIIIITLIIINEITVNLFANFFKRFVNIKDEVNVGNYETVTKNIKTSEKIDVEVQGYTNAEITLYSPEIEYEKLPVIIYIHGGGWISGSANSVALYAKLLSSNGYIVANVDYALAPEYKYPVAITQIVEVLNYLYENAEKYKIDNTNIFIGGNSAGASLSSQIGGIVSNEEYAKKVGITVKVPYKNIKGLILFNGIYNFDTVSDCHFPFFKQFAWSYTGKKNYKKYERIDELSTIKYVNTNYPSTFITVGNMDTLASQTYEFIDELDKNNVDYTSLLWKDTKTMLYHDYIYDLQTEEANKAYDMVKRFLHEKTNNNNNQGENSNDI